MVGTGFFGKVTSHGDFVARRLPPSFQQPFDAWVQTGLQESRLELGERWLSTWLSSPIWRFALAPGACGDEGWMGVMMPSVDRVGRHFPLVLAALWSGRDALGCMVANAAWFDQVETLALSSLGEGFSLAGFDDALAALALTESDASAAAVIALDDVASVATAPVIAAIASAALVNQSLWWTDGSPRVAPCLMVRAGLPAPFTALLDEATGTNQSAP